MNADMPHSLKELLRIREPNGGQRGQRERDKEGEEKENEHENEIANLILTQVAA